MLIAIYKNEGNTMRQLLLVHSQKMDLDVGEIICPLVDTRTGVKFKSTFVCMDPPML